MELEESNKDRLPHDRMDAGAVTEGCSSRAAMDDIFCASYSNSSHFMSRFKAVFFTIRTDGYLKY